MNSETKDRRQDRPSPKELLIVFLLGGFVIAADQLSKFAVERSLSLYESWAPIESLANYFKIMHISNTGVAFGLFQGAGIGFAIFAALIAVAIVVYNFWLEGGQNAIRIALGLQLGGSLGNLVDRLRQGHVTDFLDFGPWPLFNLADLSVVSGLILLLILMLREERRLATSAAQEAVEAESGASLEEL